MKVILLERITGLGAPGDLVTVKSGYGRNFLLPGKKAIPANKENMDKYEAEKAQILAAEESKKAAAQTVYDQLNGQSFEIVSAVTEENILYGSVGTSEIIEKVTTAGFDLDKQVIRLPDGPIKDLGDFEIDIELHPEIIARINIKVSPEE